jgi:peptidoglycan hydrolase CwlO-like protein
LTPGAPFQADDDPAAALAGERARFVTWHDARLHDIARLRAEVARLEALRAEDARARQALEQRLAETPPADRRSPEGATVPRRLLVALREELAARDAEYRTQAAALAARAAERQAWYDDAVRIVGEQQALVAAREAELAAVSARLADAQARATVDSATRVAQHEQVVRGLQASLAEVRSWYDDAVRIVGEQQARLAVCEANLATATALLHDARANAEGQQRAAQAEATARALEIQQIHAHAAEVRSWYDDAVRIVGEHQARLTEREAEITALRAHLAARPSDRLLAAARRLVHAVARRLPRRAPGGPAPR